MKNKNAIGMLTAVAFAVGMVGINLADGTITVFDQTSDAAIESGMFRGHLEIIQTNAEGNVIKYMQTDNAILSKGENCVALDLFGGTAGGTGATSCPADPGVFDVIALTNTATSGIDSLVLTGELTGNGLDRVSASSVTATTEAAGAAGVNVARITNTFTYTGGPAQGVIGAGLFNQTTLVGSAIFAAKDFPSSVTLNTSDQLTVNWDITTSGTEVF